jgi:tetratricopeptide (TPR) repeat protein
VRKEPVPEPVRDDSAAIERAREAYKKGNERLFSGNSAGAVEAYKESLTIYPGYAAGYRGLGLAYAQSGNTDEALNALRTYVRAAPNAHDVSLIKKRIEHLEKSTQP